MTFGLDPKIKIGLIGCGGMARNHLRRMLDGFQNTDILAVSEPSDEAYSETAKLFRDKGRKAPVNVKNLSDFLEHYASQLDAVMIITPHALHYTQAVACLRAGLDVFMEKPMVMNAAEAKALIKTRDETKRLVVVAFQGSLSHHVRRAVGLIKAGDIGKVSNISGNIWQNWMDMGGWRQQPDVSGGGFLFDSGAHMLNTISDLATEEFETVWAVISNEGSPVDITGMVMGRLVSGTLVTINACGNTVPSCASDIRVYGTHGILRTGAWGERLHVLRQQPKDTKDLEFGRDAGWEKIQVPESKGVWQEFLDVKFGYVENPSPPELGLRMARLWDAIKESSDNSGRPVHVLK